MHLYIYMYVCMYVCMYLSIYPSIYFGHISMIFLHVFIFFPANIPALLVPPVNRRAPAKLNKNQKKRLKDKLKKQETAPSGDVSMPDAPEQPAAPFDDVASKQTINTLMGT